MNKWQPDDNPHQARRIGKTLEELGELTGVLARISIQGLDAIDPASGKTNRQRMIEETADVYAQLGCNIRAFDLPMSDIINRQVLKAEQMAQWEAHYTEEPKP